MSESEGNRTYEVELDPPFLITTVVAPNEDKATEYALAVFEQQLWDGTWSIREVAP